MKINIIDDKPVCNCGVFGIYGYEDAALPVYYGLHALQHRGQEAAGIISAESTGNSTRFNIHKGFGLVSEVFSDNKIFNNVLIGKAGIGHNRYSTTGSSESVKNVQPFLVNYRMGNLAIAHNGNLTNAKFLRDKLVDDGALFQTSSDTEVLLHLIARCKLEGQKDQIRDALNQVEGSYSLTILTDKLLVGARDPFGFRPLCIGKLNGAYIITSESSALDINSAEYIRDVEPGEIVVIDDEVLNTGIIKSYRVNEKPVQPKHCIFEFIYFSRPDSKIFNSNVDKIRRKLGKELAKNHPVYPAGDEEKVIVIGVPDSSNTAAIGYQNQLEKMDIPSKLEIGLIRSHYIGRTFIQPGQQEREIGVKIKFNTVKGVLENRTVVIVDDSIVRGTTSKQLVNLIREAGPKSIHLRISSPPIKYPCFYGMDFPSQNELIAYKYENEIKKIGESLGVDSLEYMTIEEMLSAMVDHPSDHFCTSCFSGNYPTNVDTTFRKDEYDK